MVHFKWREAINLWIQADNNTNINWCKNCSQHEIQHLTLLIKMSKVFTLFLLVIVVQCLPFDHHVHAAKCWNNCEIYVWITDKTFSRGKYIFEELSTLKMRINRNRATSLIIWKFQSIKNFFSIQTFSLYFCIAMRARIRRDFFFLLNISSKNQWFSWHLLKLITKFHFGVNCWASGDEFR